MPKEFILSKAKTEEAEQIIQLFQNNYKDGYYNSNFSSADNLRKLLNNSGFIGISAYCDDQIVGFSGIYVDSIGEFNKIYLANFLVDADYRGMGVGNLIDEKKLEICNSIAGKSVVYSIVGETSLPSIQIKKTYGYDIWGIRLFYGEWEPNQSGDGHLALIGRTIGFEQEQTEFPMLHELTRKLVVSTNNERKFVDMPNHHTQLYWLERPSQVEFGQYAGMLRESEYGYPIEVAIREMLTHKEYPYIALRVSALDISVECERVLLEHNFFPTSFMPYFDKGTDVIEYQYICPEKMGRISESLANKELICSYGIKPV